MKKLVAAIVVGFLLGPVLALPAQAGGGWHGGHRHGGCCWGGFGVGVGVGVLATAPFWYPRYAYPAYAYPAYPYPAYRIRPSIRPTSIRPTSIRPTGTRSIRPIRRRRPRLRQLSRAGLSSRAGRPT